MNTTKYIILIALYVILSMITFRLGMGYELDKQIKLSQQAPVQNQSLKFLKSSPTPAPAVACANPGDIHRDKYAEIYIIKQGDSLLSIAQKQLGSFSRSNEIIYMNDDPVHPDFEAWKNLTIGAKIYLPPKYVKRSTGQVFARDEYVQAITNDYIYTGFEPIENINLIGERYYIDKDTQYLDSIPLQIGDCVRIIYDAKGIDHERQALAIIHLQ